MIPTIDPVAVYDRVLNGVVFATKHLRTQPQLDVALALLGKSLDMLNKYDEETMAKALEWNYFYKRLQLERVSLREDIDELLEMKKYSWKTALQARKVRSDAERFQRKTLSFTEGVRDVIIDEKFQKSLLKQGQCGSFNSSDKEDSGSELTIQKEKKVAEDETVSKATHAVALAATQLGPVISNCSIGQVTISNSIYLFTCPYCPTVLSFSSRIELKEHMSDFHKLNEQTD